MVVRKHTVGKESKVWHSSLLYVETDISSKDLKKLKIASKNILDNSDQFKPHNHQLAGQLEKEFLLGESQKIIQPYLINLANFYIKENESEYDPSLKDQNFKFSLSDSWINFQKKHEYNPIHFHGGDYSYVLWIQIPYELEKELSLSNSNNSNDPLNSTFNFYFINIFGSITSERLLIDKSWEGKLILFPSELRHEVFPFYTSDDYRISISGNIKREKGNVIMTYNYE